MGLAYLATLGLGCHPERSEGPQPRVSPHRYLLSSSEPYL